MSLSLPSSRVEIAPGRGRYERGLSGPEREQEKRERIEWALIELVAQRGLWGLTVDLLISHIEISRASFYELYADLPDALGQVGYWMDAHFIEPSLSALAAERTPRSGLYAAIEVLLARARSWPELAQVGMNQRGPEVEFGFGVGLQRVSRVWYAGARRAGLVGASEAVAVQVLPALLVAGMRHALDEEQGLADAEAASSFAIRLRDMSLSALR